MRFTVYLTGLLFAFAELLPTVNGYRIPRQANSNYDGKYESNSLSAITLPSKLSCSLFFRIAEQESHHLASRILHQNRPPWL